MTTSWTLPADVMGKIVKEIALGVHPADSDMEYDSEMVKFRKQVETEWEEWKKTHPNAVLDFPKDLPE